MIGTIADIRTLTIEEDFGLRNPCQVEIPLDMSDIVRDIQDTSPTVSTNAAGPTPAGCPSSSPLTGFKILITEVVSQSNDVSKTPTTAYAFVASTDQEIHSQVDSTALLGVYDVKFLVGLSTETDAELLTRTSE